MPGIQIDKYQCIKCGRCEAVCPNRLFKQDGPRNFPETVPQCETRCISCYHCVAICPVQCITVGSVSGRKCDSIIKEDFPRFDQVAMLVRARRSVRQFSSKPLDKRLIERLLDVLRWAPTARNLLPVKWLVVNGPEKTHELGGLIADWIRTLEGWHELIRAWDAGVDVILRGAPCLIVAYTDKDAMWPEIDSTIAVETLDLCATAMRLGACWAGYFIRAAQNEPTIRDWLGLSETQTVQAALLLGHTDVEVYSKIPYRPELDVTYK